MDKSKEIIELYTNTNLFYKDIAKKTGTTYKIVYNVIHKNFTEDQIHKRTKQSWSRSKLEGNNAMRGIAKEDHPSWRGGRKMDGHGYVMVYKPDWYTGRKGDLYIYEHHAVMCEALGLTEMPAGWCVHHIDGNKTNNDLKNLALLTQQGHMRGHGNGFFRVGTSNDHPEKE